MATKATLTQLMKHAFFEMMKSVGTSIPGNIVAFDPETQLAQVQIGIERVDADGSTKVPEVLIECPVQIPGGADFLIEFEINPGDEGMIIFSQRCIDEWVNSGGVAKNPILRFHNINDCMFIAGIRSQPNKITNYDNDGIKLRNKDGDQYIWLKGDGTAAIKVSSLDVDGDITSNGTITADTDVVGGGKSLKGHKHGKGTLQDSIPAPLSSGETDVPS